MEYNKYINKYLTVTNFISVSLSIILYGTCFRDFFHSNLPYFFYFCCSSVFSKLLQKAIKTITENFQWLCRQILNKHNKKRKIIRKFFFLQCKQQITAANNSNKKKKKKKQNFEPSTRCLCLGDCTTVRVRSTGRLQCKVTQEMV